MILGLYIGLFIAGLIALIRGRFKLSKAHVAQGMTARLAGLVLMLPFPLAFLAGALLALGVTLQGEIFDPAQWQGTTLAIEIASLVGCMILGFALALAATGPPVVRAEAPVVPQTEEAERRLSVPRRQPDAASSSGILWWLLGGAAVGCILCVIPVVGGVLWWLLSPAKPAPATTPVAVREQPFDEKIFQAPDRDWNQQPPPKLPREGPDGMPLDGPPRQRFQLLPEIDQENLGPLLEHLEGARRHRPPPDGLKATMDVGSTPTALALSPDGRSLAMAGNDREVTLWDAATAQKRQRLPGNEKEMTALVYSPDGRWLASADGGPFVKLRDAATGKQHASISIDNNNARIVNLAFTPDSKTLLLIGGGVVKLHDLETSQLRDFLGKNPDARQHNLFDGRFTPDGKRLYLCGYRNGPRGLERADALWDVATGNRVEDLQIFRERPFGVLLMAPNARHFIYSVPNDPILSVWDKTAGREVKSLVAEAVPTGFAFTPDGQALVVGYGDGMVRLWDYKAGKALAQFEANREDEHLPAARGDARLPAPLLTAQAVRHLALSPDGKLLVTGKSNGFKVWEAAKVFGRPIAAVAGDIKPPKPELPPAPAKVEGIHELATFFAHEKDVTGLVFSPDGRRLATVAGPKVFAAEAGEIKLWNLEPRKQIARTSGDAVIAFTPDGKQLLSVPHSNPLDLAGVAANGGDVIGFDVALCDAQTLELRPGRVRCAGCALAPDGKTILTSHITANGPIVRLHELENFKELQTWKHLKGGNVGGLLFAPDGKSFAATITGKPDVVICDSTDGKPRFTCTGHTSEVRALAFTPDGKRLATGSLDKSIRLWDATTGKLLTTLEGHTDGVNFLVYAQDGRLLVSLGEGGTLRVWDSVDEKELAVLELPAGHSPGVMALLPSGKFLAAARGSEVRLWDIRTLVRPAIARPPLDKK